MATALQLLSNLSSPVSILKGGTALQTRPRVNFIEGSNVTIAVTDDSANYKTDITISATGGGGSGTGTVTSVDLSGGTTGITFSGGPITSSGTITMAGTLEVANGGTGKDTFTSGYLKANGTAAFTTVTSIPGTDITGNISGNASSLTSVLPISLGGTNATTATDARTSLGLGSVATENVVPIAKGGTGATTATLARTALDVPSTSGGGATGTWGISISGNASTVTNGVYTSSSYADPSWITSLAGSKISGNISGNAANVTGVVQIANGGTGATTATAALNALGGYSNTNPAGYTTNTGTVTSVSGNGSVNGITLTGTVTTTGNITLGGTLSNVNLASQVTGTLPIANGGTGATTAANARTNLGINGLSVTVSNRTQLRALALQPAGTIVTELGYYTEGDGGGGTWVVNRNDTTTVDNDGTLVVRGGSYGSTSTDQSLKRVDAIYSYGAKNIATMNVRWFGAGTGAFGYSDQTPFSRALATLAISYALPGGALHIPSGVYVFDGIWSANANNYKVDIYGDGGSTEIAYAFSSSTNLTTNYAMWHIQNLGAGSKVRDFIVTNRPFVDPSVYPSSILKFSGGEGYEISGITMSNIMTSGTSSSLVYSPTIPYDQGPGGAIWINTGSIVTVNHVNVLNCFGTAICIGDTNDTPSVELTNCWLTQNSQPVSGVFANGVMGVRPTLWVERGNTLRIDNLFVENGGAYCTFPASSITSSGSYFTVTTPVDHNFSPGDYIVINGASNGAYNHKFRIASVTSTTIRINSAISGNEASVLCTSLFACCLFKNATESKIKNIYTNQGGRLIEGSIGLYFCARASGNYNAGLLLESIYSDYGESSLFIHGRAVDGYTASAILCNGIRHNGGPRSPFGDIRVELANDITINAPFMQAALTAYNNLTTPVVSGNWAYTPIVAVAISDGGSENTTIYGVADISVCGGQLQSVSDSAGIGSLVSTAMSVEGTRIKNIRSRGSLIDLTSSNSTPLVLTGGATRYSGANELVNVDYYERCMASAYASTATSVPSGTGAYINFQTNTQNDLGMWSASNPTFLTVPAGVYKVRLTANVVWAAGPGSNGLIQLHKNRAAILASVSAGNGPYQTITSQVLKVNPGDFFEIFAQYFLGGTLDVGGTESTNFTMEIVS